MSLSDDIKAVLLADSALVALLTGGIHNDVEEINRQSAPGAFDGTTKELKPCALVKVPNEAPAGPYLSSVRTAVMVYFYERSGYVTIEQAMALAFADLNETQIGSQVWNIEYVSGVYQQRDQALDCALGSLRFAAVRRL